MPLESQIEAMRALEKMLHHEIPLTKSMGITVGHYDPMELRLNIPIAPNINHKSTVFGGSLYSAAVLTGWGLLNLTLQKQKCTAQIVIQDSNIEYLSPVSGDFSTRSRLASEVAINRLIGMLTRYGKARIAMAVDVLYEGQVAVAFEGQYVLLKH